MTEADDAIGDMMLRRQQAEDPAARVEDAITNDLPHVQTLLRQMHYEQQKIEVAEEELDKMPLNDRRRGMVAAAKQLAIQELVYRAMHIDWRIIEDDLYGTDQ